MRQQAKDGWSIPISWTGMTVTAAMFFVAIACGVLAGSNDFAPSHITFQLIADFVHLPVQYIIFRQERVQCVK